MGLAFVWKTQRLRSPYCYSIGCMFDTRRQFSNLSAEGKNIIWANLKYPFTMCTYKQNFVISQLVWKPITVQYAAYSIVMWTLKTSSAHTVHSVWTIVIEVGDIVSNS